MADDTATVERVTFTRRFFGDVWLESLLVVLTLFVGWFIWLAFTAQTAQTPAKRLLNVYIIDVNTGQPVSTGSVWLREVVIKGIVFGLLSLLFTLPALANAAWVLFDRDRQALHDKMAKTIVVYAPLGLPETLQAPSLVSGAAAAPRAASSVADTGEQLRELARLRDEKVITPEEYERKRSDLAGKL